MILLLGGSGYVGQAYQRLFTRLGDSLPQSRAQGDRLHRHASAGRSAGRNAPGIPASTPPGTPASPTWMPARATRRNCLFGNAVLPGRYTRGVREAPARRGVMFPAAASTLARGRTAAVSVRTTRRIFPSARTIAASTAARRRSGEEVLAGARGMLHLAAAHPLRRGGQPRGTI